MRDSEKNDWVKLLTGGNTKPLVPKTNKYQSEFFTHKFLASWPKLLQLKGLEIKNISEEHDSSVLYAPEVENFAESFLYLPFTHSKVGLVGFVVLGQTFVTEALHHLMGGSPKVEPLMREKALTLVEKKALEGLHGPLQLSLREGLKGLLGVDDVEVGSPWEKLDLEKELSQKRSYFCEDFTFKGLLKSRMRIYLRIEVF